jgi:hypothetical protein
MKRNEIDSGRRVFKHREDHLRQAAQHLKTACGAIIQLSEFAYQKAPAASPVCDGHLGVRPGTNMSAKNCLPELAWRPRTA